MENIVIENGKNELVLKLNKQSFSSSYLIALVKRIQLEEIAQKSGFNSSIHELADQINQAWWDKNGSDFLMDTRK